MPKTTRSEMATLRATVFSRAGDVCEWPGCADAAEELAHLTHRGMGGSRTRNTADNCAALCRRHHDCLDGRTALGTLRWELNEMLRAVIDVTCPECDGSGGFIWGGDHWEECRECGGRGEKE